jgi:hypothetical protein
MSTGGTEPGTTAYGLLQVLRKGSSLKTLRLKEEPTYINHRDFRGVNAFYDQLGDAIALVN